MIRELLSHICRIVVLTNWSEIQEDVDNGRTAPKLTVVFLVLASVMLVGLSLYAFIKMRLHAKRERERLESGMRVGIPHIKALDNNLPGRSLSTLYKENNLEKRK